MQSATEAWQKMSVQMGGAGATRVPRRPAHRERRSCASLWALKTLYLLGCRHELTPMCPSGRPGRPGKRVGEDGFQEFVTACPAAGTLGRATDCAADNGPQPLPAGPTESIRPPARSSRPHPAQPPPGGTATGRHSLPVASADHRSGAIMQRRPPVQSPFTPVSPPGYQAPTPRGTGWHGWLVMGPGRTVSAHPLAGNKWGASPGRPA